MKKGFTLIELLAVILILGIIALIAIPTVNKILEEARYGVFKTTSENIMKAVAQQCQINSIKNKKNIYEYTFKDGKSSSHLDIKGNIPNNGYIFLDYECNITDYYLENNNQVYSNTEDVREDYMLKAPITEEQSIFKDFYPDSYRQIQNIYFVNHTNIPAEAIDIKDASESGNNKIKSWLIQNNSYYDLYIGSEKMIYGNYDSSFLFNELVYAIHYDFSNFNTCFISNFKKFFNQNYSIKTLDIADWNISSATNLHSIFRGCNHLESLDLSYWDTSNVNDMSELFNSCYELIAVGNINNWDTSKVTSMKHFFDGCAFTKLDLSKWNTSNVTNIYYMFGSDDEVIMPLEELYIDNFNLNNVTNYSKTFHLANNLNYIRINDISSANLLATIIPDRTADSPGTIEILGNKNGLNISLLETKNWNVI